jgi:hypothetical protein
MMNNVHFFQSLFGRIVMKKSILLLLCLGRLSYSMEMQEIQQFSSRTELPDLIRTEYGDLHVDLRVRALALQKNIRSSDSQVCLNNTKMESFKDVVIIMNKLSEMVVAAQTKEVHRTLIEKLIGISKSSSSRCVLSEEEQAILRGAGLISEDGALPETVKNVIDSAFTSRSIKTPEVLSRLLSTMDDLDSSESEDSEPETEPDVRCSRTFKCPIMGISEQSLWITLKLFEGKR